ncbi:MAG: tetratricopeptide repeat protein [Planctomycetales bacterium]|nr:tetratricopeptide repeat protein [Planctomycetales bacterium]
MSQSNDKSEQSTPESAPRRRAWRTRTRVLLIIALTGLSLVAVKSVRVYHLRKLAWDTSVARQNADWPKVEEISRKWSESDPNSALPWLIASDAAQKRGGIARAAEYLAQLPDSDPRTPPALLELGNLYFAQLFQPLDGEAACLRAIEMDPQLTEGYRRIIFYYGITLQRAKMVEMCRTAIENDCAIPETYIYLIGADWITFSNAQDMNQAWLRANPDNELFEVAMLIHWVGSSALDESAQVVEDIEGNQTQLAEYEARLREAISRYPTNPELLAYFLKRAVTAGELAEVETLLSRVPSEAGEDNRFWRYKGWLHASRNELEEAEAAYRKALELNPYDWHSQHELAGVMRRFGKSEEVELLEKKAIFGKELRQQILALKDVQSASREILQAMRQYALMCDDQTVAQKLLQCMAERY